jgi:hypothetical protein
VGFYEDLIVPVIPFRRLFYVVIHVGSLALDILVR